jgi:hypothetical protein
VRIAVPRVQGARVEGDNGARTPAVTQITLFWRSVGGYGSEQVCRPYTAGTAPGDRASDQVVDHNGGFTPSSRSRSMTVCGASWRLAAVAAGRWRSSSPHGYLAAPAM